ncbi:hypothetical protein [Brevifollis gellanilyticus]|uniref:hypothetical protein n=1 Tax=Brevifollis gellanilyticus TaxID=748831 RepID=UPI0011BECC6C|nr:hypothetical protein [Brevifollis gellanilyticus]
MALLFLAWLFNSEAGRRLFGVAEEMVKPPEPEPEVVMIFPEQVLPPPLQVKPPPKAYIRTTQNEASTVKPANSMFESDRNTIAASKLPTKADATLMMPTTEGTAPNKMELASRDHRDGELKNDAVAPSPPPTATPLNMRPPAPLTPPSILKPQPEAQPSAPQPKQVAKAEPNDDSMLKKMMEELDKESARLETDRLPIEVRKPDAKDAPETAAVKPQVRVPEDVPPMPPAPKAVPVTDEVQATAGKPEENAFSPFTRMGKNDGAISREGENAVDASATPRGIYMKQVTGAVEQKWHRYVRLARDSVTFGRVRFRFYVDKRGEPQDLRILSDARDADPRMREITLRAILDADIPPIPAELIPELEDGRMKIEYEAIVY